MARFFDLKFGINRNKWMRCWGYGLLFALISGALLARTQKVRAQERQPFGIDARSEISERALPVLQAARPDVKGAELNVQRAQAFSRDGEVIRFWLADCFDSEHNFLGSMIWDADYGMLAGISMIDKSEQTDSGAILGRADALRVARRWIKTLNISQTPEKWSLAEEPDQSYLAWQLQLVYGDRKVLISLHKQSGELLQARIHRQQ